MINFKFLAFFTIVLSIISLNSHSLGPVDGEIGVKWWNNEFDANLSEGEIDVGSLNLYGEGWLGNKWGVKGAWFDSDLENQEFSDQNRLQVEVRRRLLSISDNNFIALGGGIERIDLLDGSDSSGFRVSAEGRVGIGPAFIYGSAAWVPVFQNAGNFKDISATEMEAGVHLTLIPFVSLRLGYLVYDLDYDNMVLGQNGGSKNSGFYLGAGFHW